MKTQIQDDNVNYQEFYRELFEFIPQDRTINAASYCETLDKLNLTI